MNHLITNYKELASALKLVYNRLRNILAWQKINWQVRLGRHKQKTAHWRYNLRQQLRPVYLGIAVFTIGIVPLTATPLISNTNNQEELLVSEGAIIQNEFSEPEPYMALQSKNWQNGRKNDQLPLALLTGGTTLKPYINETFDTRAKEEAARRVAEAKAQAALAAQRAALATRSSYTTTRTATFTAAVNAPRPAVPAGSRYLTPYNGYNHFSWGWCTWFVASKYHIPWHGNAGTWLSGARAAGYTTGRTPRANSIVVTAESYWGHVAVVEKVSGGTLHLVEMNYRGFGVVSRRTLSVGSGVIKGYIY